MKSLMSKAFGLGMVLLYASDTYGQQIRSIEFSAFYSEEEPNNVLKFYAAPIEAIPVDRSNHRYLELSQQDLFTIRNIIAKAAASTNAAEGELINPTVITIQYSQGKKIYAIRDTTVLAAVLQKIGSHLSSDPDTGIGEGLQFLARNIGLYVPEENLVRKARRRSN